MGVCKSRRLRFMTPTKVLHILIAKQLENDVGNVPRKLSSGDVLLVDDNTVGHGRGDKRQTIRDLRKAGVEIEGDVGQRITEDRKKQS